ncbi:MAG: transposase, partial [Deltaproteobacteria bacterium]|nr:transposase [Deltaproteobacteria bacterium]
MSMARPLRIEFPGAVYHVTSRGNARDRIFIDDSDREGFLSILDSVTRRYNWLFHAYCLMDNHYHLVIETIEGNLSRGMRQLNGVYTQKFNWKHARTGHVFQGRFKAILVEKESYLLEVCRYVVMNPVRAKMVERPEAWRWSNYAATAKMISAPEFLTVDWILGCFADNIEEAPECYRKFVGNADSGSTPWDKVKGQLFLGSENFGKRLIK